MASSERSNILILDTEKDWLPWSEYIFTLTDEYGVKGYIDPDIVAPGLPSEPTRPSPAMVRPITLVTASHPPQIDYTRPTAFSDLTSDEREQLRWLNVEYDDDKRIYRKHTEAIAKVRIEIQRTVAKRHFTYTRAATTHAVMVKLRNRFKQTDYARMMELRSAWESLMRSTKVADTNEWL